MGKSKEIRTNNEYKYKIYTATMALCCVSVDNILLATPRFISQLKVEPTNIDTGNMIYL